ncbi:MULTISPECIES: rubrerythrin family protein [unclassified Haloarcula]|uniref:rubrerythrin family protein n=1 Tax=Haloarcula TaxID=2237 RepID=UPI000EF25288|nr:MULTISPECIES: rubrerythrin family protein [unclassified Haloarcula]RLM36430.1 rubrerythrin family protein [Haloarcula sp. Atlit-120R]RLM45187.1 rubrerythrin family protein [Haloarcula sp. Atlit-47R]
MTAADLIDAVRDDQQTELSRLGSSKTLYADTRGEMDPDVVLAAAAAREQAAHATFDAWSDDDADDDAAALFADAADETAERGDSTDAEPVDRTPAMHDVLDDLDGTVQRLGGFVGWSLVDKKVKEQYTGFFTGQADPQTASTFRSAGSDVVDLREDAADLLDAVCESDDDWDAAEAAAIDVISTAYDEYFETLEDLGVNPKPVC